MIMAKDAINRSYIGELQIIENAIFTACEEGKTRVSVGPITVRANKFLCECGYLLSTNCSTGNVEIRWDNA